MGQGLLLATAGRIVWSQTKPILTHILSITTMLSGILVSGDRQNLVLPPTGGLGILWGYVKENNQLKTLARMNWIEWRLECL